LAQGGRHPWAVRLRKPTQKNIQKCISPRKIEISMDSRKLQSQIGRIYHQKFGIWMGFTKKHVDVRGFDPKDW
jgi:hypothetical protein